MSLNDSRCPYCFNKFADKKYTDDPILTKNGSSFVFDESSGLLIPQTDPTKNLYKGSTIVKNKHITELQDIYDDNKPEAGWTPVEGEAGSFWIPNKIHIAELRDTIEKGLGITGSTTPAERTTILEQYFNYDEEGTERQSPHQLDWNDPTLTGTIWMGNISHMHIEDLRKTLLGNEVILGYGSISVPYVYPNTYINFWKLKEPTLISLNKYSPTVFPSVSESIALTEDSIIAEYAILGVGTGEPPPVRTQDWIYKINRNTWEKTNIIDFRTICQPYFTANFPWSIALFADNTYIYAIGGGDYYHPFVKLTYDGTVVTYVMYSRTVYGPNPPWFGHYAPHTIGMNKDIIYVLGAFWGDTGTYPNQKSHLVIGKYYKSTFNFISAIAIKEYDGPIYPSPGNTLYSLKADNDFVYVMNAEPIGVGIYQPRLSVYRVSDMSLVLTKDIGNQSYNPGYIGQTEKMLSLRGKCYTKPTATSYIVDLIGDMPISIYDNGITPAPGYGSGTPIGFYGDWERKMQSL